MTIRHGIDLCYIKREEFKNERLIKRFLHSKEYDTYLHLSDELKNDWLATRWAIKEAYFKAIDDKLVFNKILIEYIDNIPHIMNQQFHVIISISHELDFVIASVILYDRLEHI